MAGLLCIEYFFQLILGRYKYLSRFRAVDRSYYACRLELVDDTPRTVEPDGRDGYTGWADYLREPAAATNVVPTDVEGKNE